MLRDSTRPKTPYHRYIRQLSLPLWERTCLLEGGVGRNINGTMFALLRELQSDPRYQGFDVVWAVSEDLIDRARVRLETYHVSGVRLVVTESDEYRECLARAKYLFSDNTFPAYFTKRAEQVYLNTWHGTPLKRLGLSDIANSMSSFSNVQKNLLTADYLLFPNTYTRDAFMEDYDLASFYSGTCVLGNYPRNDALARQDIYRQVRMAEGIADDHQAIAYMPTWRGSGRTSNSEEHIAQTMRLLDDLDRGLHDHQTLFVNLHFIVQGGIDFAAYHHIRPFPDQYETYDFLAACDVLVTDYSSVMFDYAVTCRPIYLLAYDEDEYMTSKGAYLPYRSLPFPIATTVKELLSLLDSKPPIERYGTFREQFCAFHTGHAAHDLLAYVIGGETNLLHMTRCQLRPIEEALYVFDLDRRCVRETVMPQILARAEQSDTPPVVITTVRYSDDAIEAFKQLRGKAHLLVVVRRHVKTAYEYRMFDLVSHHRWMAILLEGLLHSYFAREARQLLSGTCIRSLYTPAPDGSYLMWMAKGTDMRLVSASPDVSVVGKKAARAARICLARGYEVSSIHKWDTP